MCEATSTRGVRREGPRVQTLQTDSDGAVVSRYYTERDYLTSPEGTMKAVSIIVCIVMSVTLLSTSCSGGPLRAAGAALELGSAAVLACLYAARLLQLVLYMPMGSLYADLVLSTAIGVVLLVSAVLSLTVCDVLGAADYAHGLIGIVNAGIVTASAVVTYVSVTRRWDAARSPEVAPRRSPLHPPEQEV